MSATGAMIATVEMIFIRAISSTGAMSATGAVSSTGAMSFTGAISATEEMIATGAMSATGSHELHCVPSQFFLSHLIPTSGFNVPLGKIQSSFSGLGLRWLGFLVGS